MRAVPETVSGDPATIVAVDPIEEAALTEGAGPIEDHPIPVESVVRSRVVHGLPVAVHARGLEAIASDLGRLLLERNRRVDRGDLWRDVQREE